MDPCINLCRLGKEYAGTKSCELPDVAVVLSGTLRVVMDDGSQQDFYRNEVMLLPPGHDAWMRGPLAMNLVCLSSSRGAMTTILVNRAAEALVSVSGER